ncbi:hypothetical protein [Asaia sp. VD9]|uniref:hypothetical protein n=1 Tax=Asaia sp. VD9 TaxID=3081235 RepID=UPI003015B608
MDHRVLDDIVEMLNEGAWNYTVFLHCTEMPLLGPVSESALMKAAFGIDAVIGEIKEVEKASVWPEIRDNLLYEGNHGCGPAPQTLRSATLLGLLDVLKSEVAHLVDAASTIESFWLSEGDPAYRVYWDFGFLFMEKEVAHVFLGSSSD